MGKLDMKDFQEIKSVMVGELLAETCSKLSIANQCSVWNLFKRNSKSTGTTLITNVALMSLVIT